MRCRIPIKVNHWSRVIVELKKKLWRWNSRVSTPKEINCDTIIQKWFLKAHSAFTGWPTSSNISEYQTHALYYCFQILFFLIIFYHILVVTLPLWFFYITIQQPQHHNRQTLLTLTLLFMVLMFFAGWWWPRTRSTGKFPAQLLNHRRRRWIPFSAQSQ